MIKLQTENQKKLNVFIQCIRYVLYHDIANCSFSSVFNLLSCNKLLPCFMTDVYKTHLERQALGSLRDYLSHLAFAIDESEFTEEKAWRVDTEGKGNAKTHSYNCA